MLGVNAIDPVRQGLLFERFVSEERREPPDIDVDIPALAKIDDVAQDAS